MATPAAAVAMVHPRLTAAVTNPAAAAVAVSPHCRPLLLWCLDLRRLLWCTRAILPLRCPPLLPVLGHSYRAPWRLWWPVKIRLGCSLASPLPPADTNSLHSPIGGLEVRHREKIGDVAGV